jgi:arylformamidase
MQQGGRAPEAAAIFGSFSQQELDRAYDQAPWAPNAAEIQARILSRSAEVARLMPKLTRRYGPGENQLIDIFAPPGACNAPVFAMIHGGAWQLAMREAFYGPAPAFVAAGCILAVIGFDCLPAISLMEMTGQIRHALVWIGQEIGAMGGDGRNLHLVGHSSGAHLAAVMLTTDWSGHGLTPETIRSAMLLSGLYDLHPVMLSARGLYLRLTPDETSLLSPMRHLHRLTTAVSIAWGTQESPEFRRQSEVFAAALHGMGRLKRSVVLSDLNHFEVLEALNDPDHLLTRAMLAEALA